MMQKKESDNAQKLFSKASEISASIKGDMEARDEQIAQASKDLGLACERNMLGSAVESELVSAEKTIKTLEASILSAEKWERRKSELDRQIPRQAEKIEILTAAVAESTKAIAALQAEANSLASQKGSLSSRLAFSSRNEAETHIKLIERKRLEIQTSMEKAKDALERLRARCTEYNVKISTLTGQLENAVEVDFEEISRAKRELTEKKNALTARILAIHTKLARTQEAYNNIQLRLKDLSSVEKRWALIKSLSDTANGNIRGKQSIMLETYIQMSYFERIIRRANIRLMVMSSGQYELKRSAEGERLNSQSGLDLNVIDHYNASERSVKTLSGGESFMASLSLALGLSDEIQSSSGGIRLGTMFVDEGFGSLDEDTLAQAMKVLGSLAESNLLIGVVSHVSELKERIDKQIVVRKDKSGGSRAEIVL